MNQREHDLRPSIHIDEESYKLETSSTRARAKGKFTLGRRNTNLQAYDYLERQDLKRKSPHV